MPPRVRRAAGAPAALNVAVHDSTGPCDAGTSSSSTLPHSLSLAIYSSLISTYFPRRLVSESHAAGALCPGIKREIFSAAARVVPRDRRAHSNLPSGEPVSTQIHFWGAMQHAVPTSEPQLRKQFISWSLVSHCDRQASRKSSLTKVKRCATVGWFTQVAMSS